jgi:hypothetical protein
MSKNKVTYGLEDAGSFDRFDEACKFLFSKLKQEENLTPQFLDTCCWIETDFKIIHFYEARDYALDNNWIDEKGNWLNPTF